MPDRLDRYIAKELIAPTLFGLSAFVGLFLGTQVVQVAGLVAEEGAAFTLALKLLVLGLPEVLTFSLPMAVLLGVLLAVSRLSTNSELIAMQAGGVGLFRIAAPALALGLVAAVVGVVINDQLVPAAKFAYRQTSVVEIKGRELPVTAHNVILRSYEKGRPSLLIHAEEFDGSDLDGVTIIKFEDGQPVETTYAARVVWEDEQWWMEDARSVRQGTDGEGAVTVRFERGREPVPLAQRPSEVAALQRKPEEMTNRELAEYIEILRAQGEQPRGAAVDLQLRYSIPFAALAFALLAVPLGVQPQRSGASIGFGMSIIVIFAFYVVMTLSSSLGRSGSLPVLPAAWLQDVLVGGVGLALMFWKGR